MLGSRFNLFDFEGGGGEGKRLTGHQQLRVRVPVDEELNALGRLGLLQPCGQHDGLGSIALCLALEIFGAGVSRGASASRPFVRPVAVDIVPDAAAARGGLPVLTPHAVRLLGVDEAWSRLLLVATDYEAEEKQNGEDLFTVGVDDREENEVIFVKEARNFGIIGVGEQVEGQIFDDLS